MSYLPVFPPFFTPFSTSPNAKHKTLMMKTEQVINFMTAEINPKEYFSKSNPPTNTQKIPTDPFHADHDLFECFHFGRHQIAKHNKYK